MHVRKITLVLESRIWWFGLESSG